jgi:outer membrane receptor protein involved in Fe transport
MVKSFKLALFACAASIAAVPAFAQSAAPAPTAAAPAASSAGTAVEEVIVTASRRSETVQNVAGQVTALGAHDLQAMHANSFGDFANFVPGVSFASNGPTNNLIAIRGVTTGGTQLGSGIGLYLDDVPLGASTQFGLGSQAFNINAFDLDRVEVLNGPQGTLYGANALGGTVRYITQKPNLDSYSATAELEGSSTEHGSYNDGLRFMVNMPLISDKLAIRVDFVQQFDSGYTQDPTHDRSDVGDARTMGGRIQVLAQLNSDVSVRLSVFSQNITGDGANVAFFNPTTHQATAGSYDQSYALAQPSYNSVNVYSATVDWNLHWAKLTSITAYQTNYGAYNSDVSPFYDAAFGLYDGLFGGLGVNDDYASPYGLNVATTTKKVTQEIRLASPDNKHFEWVVGGYFDHETTDETVDLDDAGTASGAIPTGYTGAGALPFAGYLPSTYQEFAVFGDATYFITPKFDVTAGIRYSNQSQTYQSNISSVLVPNAYEPTPYTTYRYSSSSNQGVETFLFNPRYHINDDTMVYARISSGFRPGGPNFVLPGSTLPSTFQPDKIWNYELGEKTSLFNGRATVDADIYDIEWSSLQATENVEGINQLVNAGNARIQGLEAAFHYRVLSDLTLNGSGSYTDARLTSTSTALGVDYTGARLPLSPKYNFAVDANYRFGIGQGYSGALDVSDVWVGERNYGYYDSALDPLYKLPAYNTVNLNLAVYTPRHMEVDFYVKNVFDTEGQLSASTLNNTLIPGAPVPVELSQPRTIGMVLKVAIGS